MMDLKKEFSEKTMKAMICLFSKWERNNLVVTHGERECTTSDTYGFPYTSSDDCAGIWNTNVNAVLKSDEQWKFNGLVLSEDEGVVAIFANNEEQEHVEIIGRIDA